MSVKTNSACKSEQRKKGRRRTLLSAENIAVLQQAGKTYRSSRGRALECEFPSQVLVPCQDRHKNQHMAQILMTKHL